MHSIATQCVKGDHQPTVREFMQAEEVCKVNDEEKEEEKAFVKKKPFSSAVAKVLSGGGWKHRHAG